MIVKKQCLLDAIERLLDQTPKGSKIILFGSYANESPTPGSDIDLLVVEPEVSDKIRETARLRLIVQPVLGRYMIPVDMLVSSRSQFERWRKVPNTVYYEAAEKGEVYSCSNGFTGRALSSVTSTL